MLVGDQRMSIASQGYLPNQKLQVEDVALPAASGAVKSASPSEIDVILGVELDRLFCDSVTTSPTRKLAAMHRFTFTLKSA